MYRYRTLITTVILGVLINILVAYTGSLFIRTACLEVSALLIFLSLFSKREDKKEISKNDHQDLKIYL